MSFDLNLESWRIDDDALIFGMAVFVLFPHATFMKVSVEYHDYVCVS